MKTTVAATLTAMLMTFATESQASDKKFIFTGWALNDASPSEILEYADSFDKTGCDGVGVKLDPSCSETIQGQLHLSESPRWSEFDAEPLKAVCRKFAKHRSLRHSFFFLDFAPRKARLEWTDDEAWGLFAENAATAARIAKDVGFEGLIVDYEDYWKKSQFRHFGGDPEWEAAKTLARRRGREVFGRIFKEYPGITLLMFQFLTTDTEYANKTDPVACMEGKRDLGRRLRTEF